MSALNLKTTTSFAAVAAVSLLTGACADQFEPTTEDASVETRSSALEVADYCDSGYQSYWSEDGPYPIGESFTNPGEFTWSVTVRDGFELTEVRVWAGDPADFPVVAGQPDYDAFTWTFPASGTSASGTQDAPVTVACGDELKVAMYAIIEGGGETYTQGIFTYADTCCDEDSGCTYTQGYWKNHNSSRRNRNQRVAWPIDENTEICHWEWDSILYSPTLGSAWMILAHQYIAARLNEANGASVPAEVADALEVADELLSTCRRNTSDRGLAIAAAEILDAYNNGEVGPGHCDGAQEDDDDDERSCRGGRRGRGNHHGHRGRR